MAEPVTTTVTELPESRVRVEAEVPADEVEKRVAVAARALGRNLRIPGFRKGKVPPPVIIQRVGREAVLDEAVRESIAGWYIAAIDAAKVVPVGEPNLDLGELPGEGEPLRFSIEIGVRPEAKLGEYKGLEVGRREPEVADEAIDNEIEQLRDRMARLETVERAAATGDFVVMDFLGTHRRRAVRRRRGPRPDGRARLRPARARLRGAARGRRRRRRADGRRSSSPRTTAPRTSPARRPSSRSPSRRSRARSCPSSTRTSPPRPASTRSTSCATTSASAWPRRRRARSRPSSARPRSTPPSRARRSRCPTRSSRPARASCGTRWRTRSPTRASSARCTCRSRGKTEDEVIAENKEPAERDLRREAVLAAVVEAEGIEATDDDVLESLERAAAAEGGSPKKLLERLRSVRAPRVAQGGPRAAQGDRPHRRVREAREGRAEHRRNGPQRAASGRPEASLPTRLADSGPIA